MARSVKPINIALQGGGSHGAFTWGVLDRFLEEERISIEAVTGTSAGAMNGAVMLQGLLTGGREEAKRLLELFWQKISAAGAFYPVQTSAFDQMMGNFWHGQTMSTYFGDMMSNVISPYQYNPFGFNPLRDIVSDLVDFEQIRSQEKLKFFVNATNVKTGKIKIFNTHEMTLDMVMASACLPSVFQAVEIDGIPYWDGGYSGNPALYPLFYHSKTSDIILVQINPIEIEDTPMDASAILDRIHEISFNSTLMREMRAIAFVSKLLREHKISDERYSDIRMHVIEAEAEMNRLSGASKMNVEWSFIENLYAIGYNHAETWLQANYKHIGKKSTIDIEAVYL